MQDNFPTSGAAGQARNFEAITPHDTNDLPRRYKAIYVGVAGTLSLVGDHSTTPVSHTVNAGAVLLVSPVKVRSTGTTASGLVGWF